MRLTNEIRDQIIRKMAEDACVKEKEKLTKRESALGVKLWKAVYQKAERDKAVAMSDGWIRMDKCLKFNLCGMNITVTVAEAVPVKSNGSNYCQRLGDIADETLRDEYLTWHGDMEKLKVKYNQIKAQGRALLYSVSTYNGLVKAWPEGKKFYEAYKPINETSGVPATLTADLNALLGVKS